MSQDTRAAIREAVDDLAGGFWCSLLLIEIFIVFFVVL